MDALKIELIQKKFLGIKWENGRESKISLKYLRDECPCAGCKGETILLKTYRPPKQQINTPGRYEIKNIETVGDYAVQISWKDGHNTGIYTWDYLLKLDKGQDQNESQNYESLI